MAYVVVFPPPKGDELLLYTCEHAMDSVSIPKGLF